MFAEDEDANQQVAGDRRRDNRFQPNPRNKACIVEEHDSTRKDVESTLPKDHEDHHAERGFNSFNQYNLMQKFFPTSPRMKILDAEADVENMRS